MPLNQKKSDPFRSLRGSHCAAYAEARLTRLSHSSVFVLCMALAISHLIQGTIELLVENLATLHCFVEYLPDKGCLDRFFLIISAIA